MPDRGWIAPRPENEPDVPDRVLAARQTAMTAAVVLATTNYPPKGYESIDVRETAAELERWLLRPHSADEPERA